MPTSKNIIYAIVLSVLIATSAVPAMGALNVYDGFDYSAGSNLLSASGGFGFSGPWHAGGFNATINGNYNVASGSLSSGSLLTSGNSVHSDAQQAIAGITRTLATPLGTPGTTQYISFLLRPEGTLNRGALNGFFGLVLERPSHTDPEIFIGKPGAGAINDYVIENRGGPLQHDSGNVAAIDETALLVVKAVFTAGNDQFTLYVNPTPGGPEPLSGTVKNDADVGTVSALTIYSTGQFGIDEIRVGDTFADVTPVATTLPEPGAALALAPITMILYRARRRTE